MFQQTVYAQYGSNRSFYGNIQLGAAPKFFQNYGAWPEEPHSEEMIPSDELIIVSPIVPNYEHEIASKIATIKRLRAEIEQESELHLKSQLRQHMRIEREAKERAFKLQARIDDEETSFILLH